MIDNTEPISTPQITRSPQIHLDVSINTNIKVKCFGCARLLPVQGYAQDGSKGLVVYVDGDSCECHDKSKTNWVEDKEDLAANTPTTEPCSEGYCFQEEELCSVNCLCECHKGND